MTIQIAKENREMVDYLFNHFIKLIQPNLIDDDHLIYITDAHNCVLSRFDADIAHAEKMNAIEAFKNTLDRN